MNDRQNLLAVLGRHGVRVDAADTMTDRALALKVLGVLGVDTSRPYSPDGTVPVNREPDPYLCALALALSREPRHAARADAHVRRDVVGDDHGRACTCERHADAEASNAAELRRDLALAHVDADDRAAHERSYDRQQARKPVFTTAPRGAEEVANAALKRDLAKKSGGR